MKETYSLIFWIHNREMSNEQISKMVCNIADLLRKFVGETVLNFETAYSKSKARHVNVTGDYMLNKLERMEKDGNGVSGYIFSFFSSLDDSRSIGVRFILNGTMPNTVTVSFPADYSKLLTDYLALWDLFKNITNEVDPYYAFMVNNLNHELSENYWNYKPAYIHTFNYFDNETIKLIGRKKLLRESGLEIVESGIFLRTFAEPLSVTNPEHLQEQEAISKRLGLIN